MKRKKNLMPCVQFLSDCKKQNKKKTNKQTKKRAIKPVVC